MQILRKVYNNTKITKSETILSLEETKQKVLLLDCSGSMKRIFCGNSTRHDALIDLTNKLRNDGLIFRQICFNSIVKEQMFIELPHGDTYLHKALVFTLKQPTKRIILVSDGCPNGKHDTYELLVNLLKKYNIVLDVFYIGNEMNGELLLRALCAATGGKFETIRDNVPSLMEATQEIAGILGPAK